LIKAQACTQNQTAEPCPTAGFFYGKYLKLYLNRKSSVMKTKQLLAAVSIFSLIACYTAQGQTKEAGKHFKKSIRTHKVQPPPPPPLPANIEEVAPPPPPANIEEVTPPPPPPAAREKMHLPPAKIKKGEIAPPPPPARKATKVSL
jgi:hypothetical protein